VLCSCRNHSPRKQIRRTTTYAVDNTPSNHKHTQTPKHTTFFQKNMQQSTYTLQLSQDAPITSHPHPSRTKQKKTKTLNFGTHSLLKRELISSRETHISACSSTIHHTKQRTPTNFLNCATVRSESENIYIYGSNNSFN